MRRSSLFGSVLLLGLALSAPSIACPNCKDAMAAGGSAGVENVGRGLSYSVIFMLAMPLVIFGTGAFAVWRAVKRGELPPL